jgi:hypothetical protein
LPLLGLLLLIDEGVQLVERGLVRRLGRRRGRGFVLVLRVRLSTTDASSIGTESSKLRHYDAPARRHTSGMLPSAICLSRSVKRCSFFFLGLLLSIWTPPASPGSSPERGCSSMLITGGAALESKLSNLPHD